MSFSAAAEKKSNRRNFAPLSLFLSLSCPRLSPQTNRSEHHADNALLPGLVEEPREGVDVSDGDDLSRIRRGDRGRGRCCCCRRAGCRQGGPPAARGHGGGGSDALEGEQGEEENAPPPRRESWPRAPKRN